jgi:quinoprotein glucose dehydrogenase
MGPSLVAINARLGFDEFRQLVTSGRGEMPANLQLDTAELNALYKFLSGGAAVGAGGGSQDRVQKPMAGPVVASGGAPGGLEPRLNEAQLRQEFGGNNRFVGPPYPKGTVAPDIRLYSDYGLGFPYVISPPWSSIVAYDLNTGTIKWRKPLGEDEKAVEEGGKDTGVIRGGERRGIVVTSTGLLFVNAADGKLRAYDADSGKVLWVYKLPAGTQGIPAMYEVGGREYLVVQSSAGPFFGRSAPQFSGGDPSKIGYITFALPAASADHNTQQSLLDRKTH